MRVLWWNFIASAVRSAAGRLARVTNGSAPAAMSGTRSTLSLRELKFLSRRFAVLLAHIDESRSGDQRIFALGGWLCCERDVTSIENEWEQRIEHEKRISAKKGFPPITRFKAADLSNLRGEYDKSKGWDEDRQKRFAKKLIEILIRKRTEQIMGFCMCAVMDNWQVAYKKYEWAEKNAYHYLFTQCLYLIGEAMRSTWPNDTVSIFHDHGPFNEAAQAAFRGAMNDDQFMDREFIVTVAPRLWRDCIALQPADLIAYEGQKSAHLALGIKDNAELQRYYRKSLRKLLSGKVVMRGLCFQFIEGIVNLRQLTNRYPAKTAVAPSA